MPDYKALYIAERRARIADRLYANRKYAELRAKRDTIAAAYRELLAALDHRNVKAHGNQRLHRIDQPIEPVIPDLAQMTDDERIAFFKTVKVKA